MRHTTGRRCLAVWLIVVLIAALCGCTNKPKKEEDEFWIRTVDTGYEFGYGKDKYGDVTMEFVDGLLYADYNGNVTIQNGEDRFVRLWQETDNGVSRMYLTVGGTTQVINSWPGNEMYSVVTLGEPLSYGEDGKVSDISIWVEQRSRDLTKDTATSNVLISINDMGTLRISVFSEYQMDQTPARRAEKYIFRLKDGKWAADNCIASKSVWLMQRSDAVSKGRPLYEATVQIRMESLERTLAYQETPFGDDGTNRHRIVCTEKGETTLEVISVEDPFGRTSVQYVSDVNGLSPFSVDEDGYVQPVDGYNLYAGRLYDHAYLYNGKIDTPDEALHIGEKMIGGMKTEVILSDEIYEGALSADGRITGARYRKHASLRVTDPMSETSVDLPIVCGDWGPGDSDVAISEQAKPILSLASEDASGWDILLKDREYTESEPVGVGRITLGQKPDETGDLQLSGDITVRFENGERFRLTSSYQEGMRYYFAEYRDERIPIAATPEEEPLVVSRFVELEDYPSAETVNKLLLAVGTQDGKNLVQFSTTNDGAVMIRVAPLAEGQTSTIHRFTYRFFLHGNGPILAEEHVVTQTNERGTETMSTDTAYCYWGETAKMSAGDTRTIHGTDDAPDVTAAERFYTYEYEGKPEMSVVSEKTENGTYILKELKTQMGGAYGEIEDVQAVGGVLYVESRSLDDMDYSDADIAMAIRAEGGYCPVRIWAAWETDHLVARVQISEEYQEAFQTLDGTVVSPAACRRTAYLEILEKTTGDRVVIPIGTGSWHAVEY